METKKRTYSKSYRLRDNNFEVVDAICKKEKRTLGWVVNFIVEQYFLITGKKLFLKDEDTPNDK